MSNFYLDVIKHSHAFGSPMACHDLGLLEPAFRAKVEGFINDAQVLGHILKPVETYRSIARQEMFFRKGLTKLRRLGMHHYGLACDLALMDGGEYHSNGEEYKFFVALAEKRGVVSGINWGTPGKPHSFRDYDHIQAVPVAKQKAIIAGTWYPPIGYALA